MKGIKWFSVVLLALVLVLSMTACGGNAGSAEQGGDTAEETEEAAQTEEEPAEEPASDGPVTLDVDDGGQIVLTPAEVSVFTDQNDDTMVTTAIGDTVMGGGSTLWPGSMLSLGMLRESDTYKMGKVAFTYELVDDADSEGAINTAGEAAKLVRDDQEYSVKVAWYSGGTACFMFDCEELPETAPTFTQEDGKVVIRF